MLCLLCSALLFLCVGGTVTPVFAQPAKILLLHSYHPEYPWVASITSGVNEALQGKNVELEIFYMDTKRKTSQEWKVQAGKLAQEKIASFDPDVVIAADDNAQIFVTQKYAGKKRPFFVFCGVNGEPEDYGFPASNVTGLIERPLFKEAIDYARQFDPHIKTVAVLSDDGPTSVGTLNYMLSQEPDNVKIVNYHLLGDFEVWKKRVLQYNIDVDALIIYTYHTIKESGQKESLPPEEVIRWTVENATIPTVGFFDFALEEGVFCGVLESGEEFGLESAKIALALIKGEDINNFPIRPAKSGLKMINLKTAEKLKIAVPEELVQSADRVFSE